MKLNKMKKRFFSLNRHNSEGFTLVELIVVIAILAILAGVGVPVYSGYITRTNKQADITLISQIEHALTLAGYNDTFAENEGGFLVLTTEGIKTVNDAGELDDIAPTSKLGKALIATFGSSYADTLKLKYGEWIANWMIAGLMDGYAQDVIDSTYYQVADSLMDQVTDLTNAAMTILQNDGNAVDTVYAMFGGDEAYLDSVAQMYGYTAFSEVNEAEAANMLVLAVANDFTENRDNLSDASGLIKQFALFNAYAATPEGKAAGFDADYEDFVTALNSADGNIDAVADAFVTLRTAADATNPNSAFAQYRDSQGDTDLSAFEAMMTGLTTASVASPEQTKAGLSNDKFFTDGLGNNFFNSYINAAAAFVGLSEEAEAAFVQLVADETAFIGIFYTQTDISIAVSDTLPVA